MIKLTALSSCAGCASKLNQGTLTEVLRKLPLKVDSNLLIGAETADDAAVYKIDGKRALVQTVDFFTPIVDDPFLYGQIAATNALSDVYAMGGRPLTALNILGAPMDQIGPKVVQEILRGGAAKVAEADCSLVGGHTIRSPEPIYGLAVTGLVGLKWIMSNSQATPGDLLVLTKPLGVGITTTGIKRDLASPALRALAVRSMTTLNTPGADLAERGWVKAGVDVTGFGLLGHLGSMCRSSRVGATVAIDRLPILSQEVLRLIEQNCIRGGSCDNLAYANTFVEWAGVTPTFQTLAADAQTSGGLLLCVPPSSLGKVLGVLQKHQTLSAAVIGRIVPGRKMKIVVSESDATLPRSAPADSHGSAAFRKKNPARGRRSL